MAWSKDNAAWYTDFRNWADHCKPSYDNAERKAIAPLYIMYFSYALCSCYKDLNKRGKSGKSNSSMAWMFSLHHILAVVLVSLSIHYGTWRAGFLTRITHDPADIVLYIGQCYRSRYEQGNGSKLKLGFFYVLNLVSWISTRVLAYGWVVLANVFMFMNNYEDWSQELIITCALMIFGCILMWLLQVVWLYGLTNSFVTFVKQPKVVVDPFHGDNKDGKDDDKKAN